LLLGESFMHVLLVEDDHTARETTCAMLERAGYTVTSVENGIAGFAALQQDRFDAIVCDVRLPFLSGRGFYEQVREVYPEMAGRMVFVSGWTKDPSVQQAVQETGRPILSKPFTMSLLVAALQDIIDAAASAQ